MRCLAVGAVLGIGGKLLVGSVARSRDCQNLSAAGGRRAGSRVAPAAHSKSARDQTAKAQTRLLRRRERSLESEQNFRARDRRAGPPAQTSASRTPPPCAAPRPKACTVATARSTRSIPPAIAAWKTAPGTEARRRRGNRNQLPAANGPGRKPLRRPVGALSNQWLTGLNRLGEQAEQLRRRRREQGAQ